MIHGVLLDLDGVVYVGSTPVPGAAAAIEAVRRLGLPILFVTNTTSRPRSALTRKLAWFGVQASSAEILAPPAAAAAWVRARGSGKVALFVPEATRLEFADLAAEADTNPADVRYVAVGDLGAAWDYDTLNQAFRLLHEDPLRELVALGATRYWQSTEGANLDVAPFVAALECASGRKAVVLGKPARAFFQQAAAILGMSPAMLLMVGDDLHADALGAKRAGLRSALVRTGKFRDSDLDGGEGPDWVLDSVCELPALLEQAWRCGMPCKPLRGNDV